MFIVVSSIAAGLSGSFWHMRIQTCSLLHIRTKSIAPRPSLHLSIGSAVFHMEKMPSKPDIINKCHVGAVISFFGQKFGMGKDFCKTWLKPLFTVCFKQMDHMILCQNKALQGFFSFWCYYCVHIRKNKPRTHNFSKPTTVKTPRRGGLGIFLDQPMHFI